MQEHFKLSHQSDKIDLGLEHFVFSCFSVFLLLWPSFQKGVNSKEVHYSIFYLHPTFYVMLSVINNYKRSELPAL